MTVPTRYLARWAAVGDRAGTVIPHPALDVDAEGLITYIGPAADAPALADRQARHLGGVLVPGLVNTHCHTPMTLLRGVGEGLPLERWLHEAMWPREARLTADDIEWGMRLGSAEMLRYGVTTSTEMYFHPEAVARAVTATGARVVVGAPIISFPETGPDLLERQITEAVEHKASVEAFPLVEIAFAPHSAYTVPVPVLGEVAALARETGSLLQIHLAETSSEGAEVSRQHGGASVPRILADHDVLGGRVIGAHGVWLSGDDQRLLAEHDASVAHCPQSNAKLASGVAPLASLLRHGVKVGLGTDGPASNNNLDLWEELRLAPLLARVTALDAQQIPATEAFWLATGAGADAIGRADLGQLTAGRRADFSRLDTDDAAFVPVESPDSILTHLVWAAGSRHVTDVWVGGEPVVVDRALVTIDEAEARAEVQQRALRIATA